MNIKIDKKEFNQLTKIKSYIVGSRLYKTNRADSDNDYLVIYEAIGDSDIYYPNYHQLQYDCIESNSQFICVTERQFYKNLFSGDSTINADVIMFYEDYKDSEKLNICRTYNIIKAFIGFAKRDIKFLSQNKSSLFHINRGLYCAEKLLKNELPLLEDIQNLNISTDRFILTEHVDTLRKEMNKLYDSNLLTLYPKEIMCTVKTDLEKKIVESNNIKEFKYQSDNL